MQIKGDDCFMKKIAVIGSNSFSGSYFIDYVLEKTNCDVIGVSRSPEKNDIFLPYKSKDPNRFTFHQLDLNKDNDRILKLFDKEEPDVIVNFAAQSEVGPSWKNPEQWFRTNCLSVTITQSEKCGTFTSLGFSKPVPHLPFAL